MVNLYQYFTVGFLEEKRNQSIGFINQRLHNWGATVCVKIFWIFAVQHLPLVDINVSICRVTCSTPRSQGSVFAPNIHVVFLHLGSDDPMTISWGCWSEPWCKSSWRSVVPEKNGSLDSVWSTPFFYWRNYVAMSTCNFFCKQFGDVKIRLAEKSKHDPCFWENPLEFLAMLASVSLTTVESTSGTWEAESFSENRFGPSIFWAKISFFIGTEHPSLMVYQPWFFSDLQRKFLGKIHPLHWRNIFVHCPIFFAIFWAITWPEKSHRSHRSHRQESVQQMTVALYVTWQFLAVLKPKTGRKKSDFPVRKIGFSENCGIFSLKYLKCLSWCLSENIGRNSLHLLLNHHVSWVVPLKIP